MLIADERMGWVLWVEYLTSWKGGVGRGPCKGVVLWHNSLGCGVGYF